eukprot:scaffold2277_cov256-Pinguiococcus_pyrenoidosus.AAC.2
MRASSRAESIRTSTPALSVFLSKPAARRKSMPPVAAPIVLAKARLPRLMRRYFGFVGSSVVQGRKVRGLGKGVQTCYDRVLASSVLKNASSPCTCFIARRSVRIADTFLETRAAQRRSLSSGV